MADEFDDGSKPRGRNNLTPLNTSKIPDRKVAVALEGSARTGDLPRITAAGRGRIAEQILQLAFEHGINVREDGALADMLASVEEDSPIPPEAFQAVSEILSYVYRANGMPDPFDAVLRDAMNKGGNGDRKDES